MMKKLSLFFSIIHLLDAGELDLGFGAGLMVYPDYIGSKNDNTLFIPYPYVSYTSEKLKLDREGLNSKLFSYNDLSIELSAGGSLPVKSSGSREGMSDLDPALELGPALIYSMYENDNLSLKLDIPLRAVLSTDFKGIEYRGYIYEVRAKLKYNINNYIFQFHTGAMWADEKYHNHIYSVKSSEATPIRAFYKAKAGYSAYKTSIGVSKRFKNIWAGTFFRHYSLNGSSVRNSPLTERNSALYGGLFVSYIFDDKFTRSIQNWLK